MGEIFSRTEALLGSKALSKLQKAHVAVFGLGGVGSAAFEALVRSGVGTISVFDFDTVAKTNFNRQLLAVEDTEGKLKTEAAILRAKQINPDAKIIAHNMFYLPENADTIDFSDFDYIIDAVDTVTAKLEIILRAKEENIPVISCMGTGNKLDITRLRVLDISKTTDCPLARIMRKELKKRGVTHLKTVWSDEKPFSYKSTGELKGNRPSPASAIFVPAAAGLLLAKEAVTELISNKEQE
ncbi:MAG: tRNA threonylcarbamoyladenosine dehydratase [Clostridia bacterium]|nr:tRNA threonylcarbamoyladenosine dehydratase [Clostridia bacterium]